MKSHVTVTIVEDDGETVSTHALTYYELGDGDCRPEIVVEALLDEMGITLPREEREVTNE